jgi:hypothetical protein
MQHAKTAYSSNRTFLISVKKTWIFVQEKDRTGEQIIMSLKPVICIWNVSGSHVHAAEINDTKTFFKIPFYLQSIVVHSANCL